MYGQGNYNSQFGRGPSAMPPPNQQQLPGPPPLPRHFQPGRPAPPPVFQPGPPLYQHSHPLPPPLVHQITPDATSCTSQVYLHPQPPIHVSARLPPMYSTDQPNTHLGNQNVRHMSPSMPPHPPRVLPPPPPPATRYRAPVHQQSEKPGGVQHLQHMPLPPLSPPLTSSSFISNPFGSFVQSTIRNSHLPSMAPLPPPPPPSDPPPVQPSPPPPISPLLSLMHRQAASNLSNSNRLYGSQVSPPKCGDKDITTFEVRLNVPWDEGSLNQEGSTVGENLLLRGSVMLDLPPTPPRPKEEKVAQKIEDLCQLISKNGLGYEDLVQQNESGNPEVNFLFGGDPGSEAAIAHEYFLWMKKKCILACKLNEVKNDSPLRPPGTDSAIKPNNLEVASRTYSPADSDMEMEDDITQSGNESGVNCSTDGKNSVYDLMRDDLDVKVQSHEQYMSESGRVAFAAQVLVEQGDKVVSNHKILAFEKPASKVYSPVINSADEQFANVSLDDNVLSGATAAAQGINSEENSSQLRKGGSPFRLLQDYASDDISENDDGLHHEFVSSLKDSSSVAVQATSPCRNTGSNMLLKAENFNEDSGGEVKEVVLASITGRTTDQHVNAKRDNQTSIRRGESPRDFQKKDPLDDASIEGAKYTPNFLKIDEFGRLVREGASGSDSDDSCYNGRQGKRGRSRSRSPLDRRRRSPWRKKEKRSLSRSWSPRNLKSRSSRSPRNQRSRSRSPKSWRSRSRSPRNRRSRSRSPRRRRSSRSPVIRHAGKFSGDGVRRERGQLPECFDFRRGRCYRGASCRYQHHDSDKGNGLKHHACKHQYLEVPPISKNFNILKEAKHKLHKESEKQHHEIEILEMQLGQDMASSSFVARKEMHVYQKGEDSIHDASKVGNFDQDGQLNNSHIVKSGSSGEVAAKILQTHVLPLEGRKVLTALANKSCLEAIESSCPMLMGGFPSNLVCDADTLKSQGDASRDRLPSENPVTKLSHSKLSDPLLQNADLPQQSDNSSVSDSSPEQTSMALVNKLPSTEALPNTTDFRHHPGQQPSPPCAISQGVVAQNMTQPPGDYNLTPQNAYQSASGERFPYYMLPNQQSHFSLSPMASWTPLAPPPPGVSSELQQGHLPPRNDSGSEIRPYAAQLPTQVGDFHERVYPPTQQPSRSISQQFVGPSLLREDHLSHLPTLGISTPSSFSQGDNPHLPAPFLQELSAGKMHTFPGDNLSPGELLKSSSQTHPYLQQQQPPYSLHRPASVSSYSIYPPELQEANQSSYPPDFRGSRTSTFYNPYASTFEQPLSSKFSSNVGSVGSRQANSSPNSAKAVGQNFPRSGGDQYDPLLHSIEPSSNHSKKINNVQKWEPSSDSDIMLRHSGSNKPLDVEENNKKKEIGGVALSTAVDNEECGETADAEVGAVENGSPSNPIGAADMNAGEVEIDQIKSPGKSKKNKESRSMKLFKVALADFVKEVLKPSWRQGNMSKEAFKTIVKKTVDKVCGAMKSHQIPKSRAKIDQYIVSSQRKLTKLVMGYVDKYVKM